jgi:hypothetical protein
MSFRFDLVVLASLAAVPTALAGTVTGKLDLPQAPERPPPATRGFIDRVENPLAPARPVAVTPYMIVTLEGDEKPASPGQVNWDLVGESFARPVIGAPVGAEVVIKNTSKTSRTLVAAEDPKLVPAGPINPTGPKSFRVPDAKVYTIGDTDAPHLKGKLVGVNTPFVASVDDAGKFEIADVPEGSYKLRVFYRDGWLDLSQDVNVGAKGKTEVNVKVPALGAGKK